MPKKSARLPQPSDELIYELEDQGLKTERAEPAQAREQQKNKVTLE